MSNRLALAALALALIDLAPCTRAQSLPAPSLRVFIAGDSTASAYPRERYPRMGWGQVIDRLFDRGVEVRNHAQSGRSARSFIQEGWLYAIAREIRAGDVLLIQFGHNDEKREDPTRYDDPLIGFPLWLRQYIDLARAAGARPVLITPVARRHFLDGNAIDQHGAYGEAVRALAWREHVQLIDLGRDSLAWLQSIGADLSTRYYLHVAAQGLHDDTHFQERGALQVACLVAERLDAIDADIARHRIDDVDCAAARGRLATGRGENVAPR